MKTLDEVIKGFEHCKSAECKECPYRILFDDDSHVPCDQFEKDDDAMHYLVEYRACQQHMEVVEQIRQDAVRQRDAHIKALGDLNRNDPLTWEELTQMERKPVWIVDSILDFDDIEIKRTGHWEIIRKVYPEQIAFYVQGMTYHKSWQGIGWQAFRKERT